MSLETRRGKIWAERPAWQALYDDAYIYAIPNRRPEARVGKGQPRTLEIYDTTATELTYSSATRLRDDIAPPGRPLARLRLSALLHKRLKAQMGAEQAEQIAARVSEASDIANELLRTSDFSTRLLDACVDVHVGTGAVLIAKGDVSRPLRVAAIPFDELACETDAYGEDVLISWRQGMTRRQAVEAFPDGRYPPEFARDLDKRGQDAVTLEQCFLRSDDRLSWQMHVYVMEGASPAPLPAGEPVTTATFRTCPVIIMRYQRVPGEGYGRGPVLNALPTIKSLNKLMEIQLRSASVALMGIWAYQPGGMFNPDTAKVAPGAFWPVERGPWGMEVQRLDTQPRLDVAQESQNELRKQIASMFQREENIPQGLSPKSATEFMLRDKEQSRSYRGAYGRIVEDFVPRVFWRVLEIARDLNFVDAKMPFDELMMQLDVLSPLSATMRAQSFEPTLNYLRAVMEIGGPQAVQRFVDLDAVFEDMAYEMALPPEHIYSAEERAARDQQQMMGMMAAQAAQAAAAAPPPELPSPATPA